MRLATTTADFRGYLPNDDIAGAVRLLHQCGFRHVDASLDGCVFEGSALCSEHWREWAEGIRRTAEELGVDFVQAHASDGCFEEGPEREKRVEMLKREMEVCRILGIPGMVVHGVSRPGGISREEFLEANTRFYRQLLPSAEEFGVRIYTENTCRQNCPSYFLFEGKDFNELRQRLGNPPLFGCCWDVGHANCQGVDQYQAIRDMGDGLMAVHIHDNNFGWDMHLPPFTGNTCYDAILAGLAEVGFRGPFTLEAFSLPVPQNFCFCRRPHFTAKGPDYDRLGMLPLEFKLRSETLMHDIAKYMLETYGCFEP